MDTYVTLMVNTRFTKDTQPILNVKVDLLVIVVSAKEPVKAG